MVELRKRPAPPPAAPQPTKRKASATSKVKAAATETASKAKAAVTGKRAAVDSAPAEPAPAEPAAAEPVTAKPGAKAASTTSSKGLTVGETLDLNGFGGEIKTSEGDATTLAALVERSRSGVAIFTYPKASTPGCTKQACLFRDDYSALTGSGLDVYGLSADSPQANTTFKTKQNLPYLLLCDPAATLIGAIGLKKSPKGTVRGVFVVDKAGKVLAAEPGGPAETVEVVRRIVKGSDEVAPKAEETKL